jgi:exonuclease III
MGRNRVNVMGLSEVRWTGAGVIESEEVKMYYSGGEERQRGVAVVLDKEVARRVSKVTQDSDRVIMVRIEAEPVDLVVIQVYMPTTEHEDEEIEQIYEKVEGMIKQERGRFCVIIMGDMNAVVGEGREGEEIGNYGLGRRNERGEMLMEFCKRNKMMAANTWFQQEKRRRYTWKQPGEQRRYQLDYILVAQRYRNSVKNAKAYPGADVDSDHNLVVMKFSTRLKRVEKSKGRKRWNMANLRSKEEELSMEIETRMERGKVGEATGVRRRWKLVKEAIVESAEKVIGRQTVKRIRKPWITDDMIKLMDERRRWKGSKKEGAVEKYVRLNNELRRETDRAKEEWWSKECDELERLEREGKTDCMYAKVRQLTGTAKVRAKLSTGINAKDGELLTEKGEIKRRWKEYVEELYDKESKPEMSEMGVEDEERVEDDNKGPEIIRGEIRKAIRNIKKGKAVGVDDIPAEFLKVLGEKAYSQLEELCMQIYMEGIWPDDFTQVVMIPIEKKHNATECSDHRTISLVSHASKILLQILTKRIEAKTVSVIGKTQFGFRRGVGTRDAIGVLRTVVERSIEFGNEIYICFVDFEKAFDRVNWAKMLSILKNIGVDWRDRRLISELYMGQTAVVKIGEEYSEPCVIGRGVRQGCCLSPLLFSLYAEEMMNEALEDTEEGVVVGGNLLKDIKFADDQAMIASREEGLQKLMDKVNATAQQYDMRINVKKTKVMKVTREGQGKVNIVIDGQQLEQVSSFKYLGSWITEDGKCELEVRTRIARAKEAFSKRRELLTKSLSHKIKKKMIKTLVWSIALYASETWTLRKEEYRKLDALEMWLWRRMEKVSWTQRKTNEEILRMVGEKRRLVNMVVERKKRWIGHVLRGDGLMREVLEGRMIGKRPRGRPRMGMLEELKEDSYEGMKRRAQDRVGWRNWVPGTCLRAEHY